MSIIWSIEDDGELVVVTGMLSAEVGKEELLFHGAAPAIIRGESTGPVRLSCRGAFPRGLRTRHSPRSPLLRSACIASA